MSLRIGVHARKVAWISFRRACCLVIMCAVAGSFGAAQIKIVNPQELEVPEQTAKVLLRLSCKVAAEQFHVLGETEFPLTLVLGEENEERYTADDPNRVYTVYMKQWSESCFTTATMMIAVRRLALPMQKKMITEVLERAHAISPIQVKQLSREGSSGVSRAE